MQDTAQKRPQHSELLPRPRTWTASQTAMPCCRHSARSSSPTCGGVARTARRAAGWIGAYMYNMQARAPARHHTGTPNTKASVHHCTATQSSGAAARLRAAAAGPSGCRRLTAQRTRTSESSSSRWQAATMSSQNAASACAQTERGRRSGRSGCRAAAAQGQRRRRRQPVGIIRAQPHAVRHTSSGSGARKPLRLLLPSCMQPASRT